MGIRSLNYDNLAAVEVSRDKDFVYHQGGLVLHRRELRFQSCWWHLSMFQPDDRGGLRTRSAYSAVGMSTKTPAVSMMDLMARSRLTQVLLLEAHWMYIRTLPVKVRMFCNSLSDAGTCMWTPRTPWPRHHLSTAT